MENFLNFHQFLFLNFRQILIYFQQILISKNTGPAAKALAKNGVTTYFGTLTKQAVIEFQKANNIIPASGYFGAMTRVVIGK